jgi:UPF0148 protein
MPVRKEDEIMAEYLLKGGKMLEKSCKTCGCPLFEVKGKTLCVVCEENAPASKNQAPDTEKPEREKDAPAPVVRESAYQPHEPEGEGMVLAEELAGTLISLCERIRNEKDPNHVLTLMGAVKTGVESLHILCQL